MRNYSIKTASLRDVQMMLEWSQIENWGLGIHDAIPYHMADPQGFFIGYLDEEPISCVSAFRYSDDFGFMGLYLVKPEYRGQGYGLPVWQRGMDHLKGCNIGLDGVLAQQEKYKRLGFQFAYHHLHCTGSSSVTGFSSREAEKESFDDLKNVPFDRVIEYQRKFFPIERASFLSAWMTMPETLGIVAQKDGRIRGLGVLRKCQGGYTVAPLFADEASVAEQIYLRLCQKLPNHSTVFLDVPEVNQNAVSLAERVGLKPSFKAARMYTGDDPRLNLSEVFGVTSLTMG